MNILLLYPKCPDNTFWSLKHALPFIHSKAAYPPLGLLTIAAILPDKWNKKLIDLNVRELKDDDITWADLIFIGAMIVQSDSAVQTIRRCKSLNKKIVAGGPLFLSGDWTSQVDYLLMGEVEDSLPVFLKDLDEGEAKQVYSSKEYPDISKTPVPLWSLINFKDYSTMSLQYSRGCPFNCEFCQVIAINGRIPRTKGPEQMMREFESLYNAGWRGTVFIVDDNFIGNKIKTSKILTLLVEWQKRKKYPFSFITQSSIDLADSPQLMDMMREANFNQVFIGIETPNPDSLSECDKKQNLKTDLVSAVKKINNNGLQVTGGFIVGFDHDPKNIFDLQIDFIQKAGIVTAMVGVLNALPGTKLWDRLKKDNRILRKTSGDNTDGGTNIVPLMDIDELKTGYRKVLSELYSKKNFYKRIDTLLENYNPSVVSRIKKRDIYTLIKVIWSIGLFSRGERIFFWKMIIKTLFTRIRALPDVVACIILGFHFYSVCNSHNMLSVKEDIKLFDGRRAVNPALLP